MSQITSSGYAPRILPAVYGTDENLVLDIDQKLAERKFITTELLGTSLVIWTHDGEHTKYYSQLFQAASHWLLPTDIEAEAKEYADYMASLLSNECSLLQEPSSFDAIAASPDGDKYLHEKLIAHINRYAPYLAEELPGVVYTCGTLTCDVGRWLKAGTLLIKRHSKLATVIYPIIDETQAIAEEYRDATDAKSIINTFLGSLGFMAEMMNGVPGGSNIGTFIQSGVNIIQLLTGKTSESELKQALKAMPGIVAYELSRATLKEKVINLQAFCNQLEEMIDVLGKSPDQANYIRKTVLPKTKEHLESANSAGVYNSYFQLNGVWQTVKWNDSAFKDEVLIALALGTTQMMELYHTRVCSYLKLASVEKDLDRKEAETNNMIDAYNEYTFFMESSPLRPNEILDRFHQYRVMRKNETYIEYSSRCNGSFCTSSTYTYYDQLRLKEKLGSHSYIQSSDARAKRQEYMWQQLGKAESKVLNNEQNIKKGILGYHELQKAMSKYLQKNNSFSSSDLTTEVI